jgi:hypothetical protein
MLKQIIKTALALLLPFTCAVAGDNGYELVYRQGEEININNPGVTITESLSNTPVASTNTATPISDPTYNTHSAQPVHGGTIGLLVLEQNRFRRYAIEAACLVPFVVILSYGSSVVNALSVKTEHLRNEYCHTTYPDTDSNCMNLACLPQQGLTVAGYEACYDSRSCWNDGTNVYSVCLDVICQNTQMLCASYQKYYHLQHADDDIEYQKHVYYFQHGGDSWAFGIGISALMILAACAVVLQSYNP